MDARYDLFPVTRAIPEDRQIGRTEFIDRVESAVRHGANVLLLEARRTGKSSVAHAVVERLRRADPAMHIGLAVDLSDGTQSSAEFAEQIRRQALQQQGLRRLAGAALAAKEGGRTMSVWIRQRGAAVGEVLGEALGDDEIAAAIPGLLPSGTGNPLRDVLEALDRQARAADIRVVIFIDEVHKLTGWPDEAETKEAIHAVSTRNGTHLNFIFAGSERSAVAALFGPNDPFDFFGDRLDLPEISYRAWKDGLLDRFTQAGLAITSSQITKILRATDGHPGRTIAICRNILSLVGSAQVTDPAVEQAIAKHNADQAWKKLR